MELCKKLRRTLPFVALALCFALSALMGCGSGGGGGGGGGAPAATTLTAHLAGKVVTAHSSSGWTFVLSYNAQGNAGTYSASRTDPSGSVAGGFTVASYSESGHNATLVLAGTTVTSSSPTMTPEQVMLNGTYTITWNADFTAATWTGSSGFYGNGN